MQRSVFCLVPPGYGLWSFRFFEALAADCIPVLYDDGNTVLPFESSIKYDAFVVRIPTNKILNTLELLQRYISERRVRAMQEAIVANRAALLFGVGGCALEQALLQQFEARATAVGVRKEHDLNITLVGVKCQAVSSKTPSNVRSSSPLNIRSVSATPSGSKQGYKKSVLHHLASAAAKLINDTKAAMHARLARRAAPHQTRQRSRKMNS